MSRAQETMHTMAVDRSEVNHAWSYVMVVVALILALPPAIYGYLAYRQFDFFHFTYYIPYEELFVAFRTADPVAVFNAPLLSANMTSGFLLSSMYNLTVGQFFISLGLGVAMGLSLAGNMTLRKVCATSSVNGSAAATGCGVIATLTASSTGLLGCCAGSALSGGLLSLAGVSGTVAGQVANVSPMVQAALMALFVFDCLRVRKRLETFSMPKAG